MIGERIKRARTASGLSQRALAERAELSAMAISKFERDELTPTSETLLRLAKALDTRVEFFFRPDSPALERTEYRKRSSLGKKQLARVEADVVERVERFLEVIALFPQPPVEAFAVPRAVPARVETLDAIEQVAEAVRGAWGLGLDSIEHLAETLETHGVLVVSTAADGDQKFDGLAATVAGYPLIVVGAQWPGDRQRFTMAHELGHLTLAGRLGEALDEEKACNRFAGAFLAPRAAVLSELAGQRSYISPGELAALKKKYGLSMLAWVFRACDVGRMSRAAATDMFRTFSRRGWRKREPGEPVPPEVPKLFERLVLHALAEDMISASKGAELLGVALGELRDRIELESRSVAPRQ
ncbi:MAG: XRE family transcriptional regulator [Myxococcota bacterium]